MKYLFLCLVSLLSLNVQANICIDVKLPESDFYTFQSDIEITSFDGIKLSANLLRPVGLGDKKLPTIIFVNSWLFDEHEYLSQAIEFTKKGYQVLSYSARGWGCSGGYVDVTGPNDMKDVSTVLDYLEMHTNIDINNTGMSGISYGGGMSLMAVAHDTRLKTVAVMSAWASLSDALYHQQTPRLFWGGFLLGSGAISANLDPKLGKMFKDLISTQDVSPILEWTKSRSAINFIDRVNQRGAPIFIANSFGDNLFQPNNVLKYFEKLTGPRKMMLVQGTHATAEFGGLAGFSNRVWKHVHNWFDYYLKNEGVLDAKELTIISDLEKNVEQYKFNDFLSLKSYRLNLNPRSLLKGGRLTQNLYKGDKKINSIHSGFDSRFNTGIPFISALLDGHLSLPVTEYFPMIDYGLRRFGITFKTGRLKEKLAIRGTAKLNLSLSSRNRSIQLVGYLYDVGPLGRARLITHGVSTSNNFVLREFTSFRFDMVTTTYDIRKGHRLLLALDTFDALYAPPLNGLFNVDFLFSKGSESYLEFQVK